METPSIYFCGLSCDGELLPHIWTSTTRAFTITFHIPCPTNPTSLDCKLFGIQRCKFNEDKYNRASANQPEEDEMVSVQEEALSIISISNPKANITPRNMNDFLCTIPSYGEKEKQVFSVTFGCVRNHWERNKKEKFMMFALKLIVNDTFVAHLRLYAQKTAPQHLESTKDDVLVSMIRIQPKQLLQARIAVSPPVPKKQKTVPKTSERIQRGLEILCNSSPETSDSDSDRDKRPIKRRFAEEEFVLDTSPLPAELIVVWSNVLSYCNEWDSSPESSPGPVINTFPVTIDLTTSTSFLEKRMKFY